MIRLFINPVFRVLFLLGFTGVLLLSVSEGSAIKARISNVVFDTYISLKPRQATFRSIFIDIDDESLSKIGQWPWPRSQIAQAVRNISASGAAVIIFDGVLAEPDRTSPESILPLLPADHPARSALEGMEGNDALLSDAIKNSGNFVAGFSHGSNPAPPILKRNILIKEDIKKYFLEQSDLGGIHFLTTAQFLPELQESAAGNGSFMASAESDAVIRRTGLIFHDGKTLYPSLVLEAIRLYEKQGREYIKVAEQRDYSNFKISEPFEVTLGRYKVPMDSEGKMWVYYRHFDNKSEEIPIYKFLDEYYNAGEKPDLQNKIVFIASSAEGLMDLRATPLGMQPGVKVHMNALEQILQARYLIRPYAANAIEILAAVCVCLALIALSFYVGAIWLAALAVSSCAGAFMLSWHLFTAYGGLFDPVAPALMILLVFLAASVLSFLQAEFERGQVRQAFGLYISPDFMKELTKDPDKLRLGGEIRDLTVMFTDIRSFTTISEGLPPEELIQLMNDFLTPMSDLVMQNRGTIDKYMGDAMMAFWNAPLDDPDHARNALRAALGMQAALEPINARLRARALEKGKAPILLNCGIGVNTGASAVGNMGSKQRFAYSTLGDSVNLASRLEGQTKTYDLNILIGESTAAQAADFALLEVDLIQVKGKTKPVHVYTVLGAEADGAGHIFKEWRRVHDDMLKAYRSRDFEGAFKLIKECESKSGGLLETLYALYSERCVNMMKSPPPDSWDGVYEAKTK